MGRNTFNSLKEPLKRRTHVVLTGTTDLQRHPVPTVRPAYTLDQALKIADSLTHVPDEEVFIMGGEQVYRQTLEFIDKAYVTMINKEYEGDTFYPADLILKSSYFKIVDTKKSTHSNPSFKIYTCERKDD